MMMGFRPRFSARTTGPIRRVRTTARIAIKRSGRVGTGRIGRVTDEIAADSVFGKMRVALAMGVRKSLPCVTNLKREPTFDRLESHRRTAAPSLVTSHPDAQNCLLLFLCSTHEPCRHGPYSSFRWSEEPHGGITTVLLRLLT